MTGKGKYEMAIIKVNRTKNYTVMSNHHLRNENLSLKAKALMSIMLSLPDSWDYSVKGLVAICKESENTIVSALKELKEQGYLVVIKLMPNETNSGRIEYQYNIYEEPKKQEPKKQGLEFQGLEKQGLENCGQLNTNILSTKELNTKDVKKNNKKEILEKMFEEFYSMYPRKKSNASAIKTFYKINPDEKLFEEIMNGLKKQIENWKLNKTELQFMNYPASWLNQRKWEDEFKFERPKTQKEIEDEIWERIGK
jgi:hypothetical protein